MDERALDDDAEALVRAITERLEEVVRWHIVHGSTGSRDQLLDIALKQEAERLELLMNRHDEAGRTALADAYDAIREDVLPSIVHQLRSKR